MTDAGNVVSASNWRARIAKVLAREHIREIVGWIIAGLLAWAAVALVVKTIPLIPAILLVVGCRIGELLVRKLLYKLFGA